jgi:hypothetical protein
MAQSRITTTRTALRSVLAAVTLSTGLVAYSGGIAADVDLSGSWSGGGSVSFSTGSKEKARCRATYAKAGVTSYSVTATCATASGKVAQTASVKRSGPSSFTGSFYNADFDTSGSIHVSVYGNSQSVTLTSTKASASLRLSR